MSRVLLRRGRILPGPLKSLEQVEGRSPVPMASLALTAAVMAAGLLLMPQLSSRISIDPEPMVEVADAGPAIPDTGASVASPPLLIAATPVPAEPVVTPPPARVAVVAPEPALAKPAVDRSLFELDLLPVLRADHDTAATPRTAARRTTGRPIPESVR